MIDTDYLSDGFDGLPRFESLYGRGNRRDGRKSRKHRRSLLNYRPLRDQVLSGDGGPWAEICRYLCRKSDPRLFMRQELKDSGWGWLDEADTALRNLSVMTVTVYEWHDCGGYEYEYECGYDGQGRYAARYTGWCRLLDDRD